MKKTLTQILEEHQEDLLPLNVPVQEQDNQEDENELQSE